MSNDSLSSEMEKCVHIIYLYNCLFATIEQL